MRPGCIVADLRRRQARRPRSLLRPEQRELRVALRQLSRQVSALPVRLLRHMVIHSDTAAPTSSARSAHSIDPGVFWRQSSTPDWQHRSNEKDH